MPISMLDLQVGDSDTEAQDSSQRFKGRSVQLDIEFDLGDLYCTNTSMENEDSYFDHLDPRKCRLVLNPLFNDVQLVGRADRLHFRRLVFGHVKQQRRPRTEVLQKLHDPGFLRQAHDFFRNKARPRSIEAEE